MEQNFSSTKLPTVGASSAIGGAAAWSNPSRITADDGSSASWAAFAGAQQSLISGSSFGFQQLPPSAVIDGIEVYISGSQTGCYGDVALNISGTSVKDIGALTGSYGGPDDLWGASSISPSDIATISLSASANDVSGGDGIASIDYVSITVYWHIELTAAEADVPIRVAYKVYSREGRYLGELPKVTSPFGFSQDINSAGSIIDIVCGVRAENTATVDEILDDAGDPILDNNDLALLGTDVDVLIATGDSDEDALFKNSNRVKVWVYDYWHPNGKIMFSGQVNKVSFQYGSGNSAVQLTVISDGVDLNNYIARGYPFAYSTDVSQTSQNGYVTVTASSKIGSWTRYGQTWLTGGSVTNVGAITLKLLGTATVTLSVYDGVGGNLIGSVSRNVANGAAADVQFEMAQLLAVASSDEVFMAVSVNPGQSIRVYKHGTSSTYANGSMYVATYSGGSGGGSYAATTGDFYFITKYGSPTTTTTYSSDDPVTEMMSGILADYNARGGYVVERDFLATGLSLTYTFNQATIYEALRKVVELSQTGYYSYIDLGTAEMDILMQSATADFTIVRGKDINELDLTLSIEQVKNYLLFSGGETAPNVNLYRDYQDTESTALYGLRTVSRTDNRVTLTATADAIGDTFIEEESDETQETSVTIPVTAMDISLLTPGKTMGFRNFGNFIDQMVLQIVRRDYATKQVTLSLGRLPIRMNDQIQRINRGLLNEQTVNNPTAPS